MKEIEEKALGHTKDERQLNGVLGTVAGSASTTMPQQRRANEISREFEVPVVESEPHEPWCGESGGSYFPCVGAKYVVCEVSAKQQPAICAQRES